MTNNSLQTFKGGWDNLADAKHSTNQTTFSDTPKSFFMRPDGTMIFILFGNVISAYPLLVPYDPQSKGGVLGTFEITEDTDPVSITFDNVGSKLIVGGSDTMKLYDYDMPANWDITSIVSPPVSIDAAFLSSMGKISFSTKGDFIFNANLGVIFSFPLPTPFDITSFSGVGTNHIFGFNVASFAWKPQGDRILVTDNDTNNILEFDVSTPWDVTTIVSSDEFFNYSTDITIATDIAIHPNGRQFFTLDETEKAFSRFILNDDWEISSASFFTNHFMPNNLPVFSISWKRDGTKFFVLSSTGSGNITEYVTKSPFNMTNSIAGASFLTSAIDTNVQGMWFSRDGTMCFIVGAGSNTISKLILNIPWDISTMTDSGESYAAGAGEFTLASGISLRADGKKIYVVTQFTDNIYEYDLSIPFNLNTVSFLHLKNFSSDIHTLVSIFFKPDGSQIFVGDSNKHFVLRYILSTPWDITSAILADKLDISSFGMTLRGISISEPDGDKLYIVDSIENDIFGFDMSKELVYSIQENFGDWFDFSWQHRIPLTINNNMVPSEQIDFPTLINNIFPSLIGVELRELRFVGPDKIQLQYEIQEFNNTTGKLIAWVKKPTINNGDVIYIYYDSETATDEQNPQVVWSDYSYVAHLNNIPGGVGSIIDSSPNPKNATPIDNPIQVDGVIGKALEFNGTSNYIDLGIISTGDKLMLANKNLAISFILKPMLFGDDFQRIISKSNGASGDNGYDVALDDDRFILYQNNTATLISNDIVIDDTVHYHVTLFKKNASSSQALCYINGIDALSEIPIDHSNPDVETEMKIARWNHTVDRRLRGVLEHLTITTNIPTPDLVATEYNNTHDNSMFFSTGFIQSLTFTENSIIAENQEEIIDQSGGVLIYQ